MPARELVAFDSSAVWLTANFSFRKAFGCLKRTTVVGQRVGKVYYLLYCGVQNLALCTRIKASPPPPKKWHLTKIETLSVLRKDPGRRSALALIGVDRFGVDFND